MPVIQQAPYCRSESEAAGTNDEQFRAGIRLVELAIQADPNVEFVVIETTKHKDFSPWVRIKGKKGQIRAIAEIISSEEVLIHVILPRDSHTYEDVEALWKQYRRARPSK
jgi:hypothetical protein